MEYSVLFAILFALVTVNNAQMEPKKLSFDPFQSFGSLLPGPNGGGFDKLPGGPVGGAIPDGDLELQKIQAEGCEGMSYYVMGRQMRQSCKTYCGSSFMTGKCYGGVCYCAPH